MRISYGSIQIIQLVTSDIYIISRLDIGEIHLIVGYRNIDNRLIDVVRIVIVVVIHRHLIGEYNLRTRIGIVLIARDFPISLLENTQ